MTTARTLHSRSLSFFRGLEKGGLASFVAGLVWVFLFTVTGLASQQRDLTKMIIIATLGTVCVVVAAFLRSRPNPSHAA